MKLYGGDANNKQAGLSEPMFLLDADCQMYDKAVNAKVIITEGEYLVE